MSYTDNSILRSNEIGIVTTLVVIWLVLVVIKGTMSGTSSGIKKGKLEIFKKLRELPESEEREELMEDNLTVRRNKMILSYMKPFLF